MLRTHGFLFSIPLQPLAHTKCPEGPCCWQITAPGSEVIREDSATSISSCCEQGGPVSLACLLHLLTLPRGCTSGELATKSQGRHDAVYKSINNLRISREHWLPLQTQRFIWRLGPSPPRPRAGDREPGSTEKKEVSCPAQHQHARVLRRCPMNKNPQGISDLFLPSRLGLPPVTLRVSFPRNIGGFSSKTSRKELWVTA